MPERPTSSATPEPGEPPLRAGTWQPRPRARHARARAEADDDPLRLAPEELPWGIPARAAGHDQHELPPAIVIPNRRSLTPVLIAAATVVLMLVVVVIVLVAVR
jgi:hypothetical protein